MCEQNGSIVDCHDIKKTKSNLRVRESKERESLLSTLYDSSKHFQSLCGFLVIVIAYHVTLRIVDYLKTGPSKEEASFLYWSFCQNFVSVWLVNWIYLQVYAISCYYLTRFWAEGKIHSFIFTPTFLTGVSFTFYLLYRPLVWDALSMTLRSAFMGEQLRIIMKVIAFAMDTRKKKIEAANSSKSVDCNSNLVNTVEWKGHKGKEVCCCSLSHYVYFLFAPTLIFRDKYIKSSNPTNWTRVFYLFAQFVISVGAFYELCRFYARPPLELIGKQPMTFSDMITLVLACFLVGLFIFQIAIGYIFLHCWLNMWAEMLKFGDREFYRDWWNATNGVEFYRLWNLLIGDWIFEYIYMPLTDKFKSRNICSTVVLATSGLIHDYILSAGLESFLPVFTIGMTSLALSSYQLRTPPKEGSKTQNSAPTLSHFRAHFNFFGVGLVVQAMWVFLIATVWYSRKNCPTPPEGDYVGRFWNAITPSFWKCAY